MAPNGGHTYSEAAEERDRLRRKCSQLERKLERLRAELEQLRRWYAEVEGQRVAAEQRLAKLNDDMSICLRTLSWIVEQLNEYILGDPDAGFDPDLDTFAERIAPAIHDRIIALLNGKEATPEPSDDRQREPLTWERVRELLEEGRKLGEEARARFDETHRIPSELWHMVLR